MATYFATKIDTNDCLIVDAIKVVNQPAGQLYPNPTSTSLTIKTNAPIQEIVIYNLQGELILIEAVNNRNSYTLNHLKLENNVYLCSIRTDLGVIVKRLIINN